MKRVLLMLMMAAMAAAPVWGNNVTLTGVDAIGTSSFNTAGLWDDGMAPSAGNDYFVPDGTRLRTPADGDIYTFAGDSLTINNTTPYGDGFMYKGTGNTGSITIDNFILDGGLVSHANGGSDICNLYGGMMITANGGRLYSKQGPINVYSAISGSGQIDILPSDAYGNELTFLSSANTFTGNIVSTGRFTLADDANLNYVIGASGINNSFDSSATIHSIFNGDFVFDLSGAGTNLGDSWVITNSTDSTATYYGATFSVLGFTALGDSDTWLGNANGVTYQYQESTGVLTVVPEPATLVLLGLGGLLLRRKR